MQAYGSLWRLILACALPFAEVVMVGSVSAQDSTTSAGRRVAEDSKVKRKEARRARGVPQQSWEDLHKEVENLILKKDVAGALPLSKRLAERAKTERKDRPSDQGIAFGIYGTMLYRAERFEEAIPVLQEAFLALARVTDWNAEFTSTVINTLGSAYQRQGQLKNAEEFFLLVLNKYREAIGKGDLAVVPSLTRLATFYMDHKRFSEAEALLQEALDIQKAKLPPNHPGIATGLNNLGRLYSEAGQHQKSEAAFRQSLNILEHADGDNAGQKASTKNNLGEMLQRVGRYAEAEPLLREALEFRSPNGSNDEKAVPELNNLGTCLADLGREREAITYFKRAVRASDLAVGEHHIQSAKIRSNLGGIYRKVGELGEAQRVLEAALVAAEIWYREDHPNLINFLNNLATLHADLNNRAVELPLLTRALRIAQANAGRIDPFVHAGVLNNLAMNALAKKDYSRARADALAARDLLVSSNLEAVSEFLTVLSNVALTLVQSGSSEEAIEVFQKVLQLADQRYGRDHDLYTTTLIHIAQIERDRKNSPRAIALISEAIALREARLGPEDRSVADAYHELAVAYSGALRKMEAFEASRNAVIVRGALEDKAFGSATAGAEDPLMKVRNPLIFDFFLAAADILRTEWPSMDPDVIRETFMAAQRATTNSAGTAVAQLARRLAHGEGKLAKLIRARQDLSAQRILNEQALVRLLSRERAERDANSEKVVRQRSKEAHERVAALDAEIRAIAPDLELSGSRALSLDEVQKLLLPNEALLLLHDVGGHSFSWVVTAKDARWLHAATPTLADDVAALRCGLDRSAWLAEGGARCRTLLQVDSQADRAPLPFDLRRAHRTFAALIAPFDDLIQGRHLLVVLDRSLSVLPMSVLLTEPASEEVGEAPAHVYPKAKWLGLRQPITTLPSVASLQALRERSKAVAQATRPYLGFGNPLLVGDPDDATDAARAKLARAKQRCPANIVLVRDRIISLAKKTPSLLRAADGADAVRAAPALPETSDELCAVGRRLHVPESEIWLGERATKQNLRALNASGALRQYRIIHFATHGVEGGVVGNFDEPGLLLTPALKATDDADDGYLAASDIAKLELNADWVILSACNTASGTSRGTESLSGLARAFFYAGARAMLVSHWEVYSEAAVELVTRAFNELESDPNVGRAEAMRRSMRTSVEQGGFKAHPAYWAPFVLVGEGAR